MTRTVSTFALAVAVLVASAFTMARTLIAAELSRGQQAVEAAVKQDQFTFILFYRSNDAITGAMRQTLKSALSQREDATILPVQIDDQAEHELIAWFDATRLPMPAVAVLAPNGAVTSVFPQRVTPQQLTAAIVSPRQADCLKALQDEKIVLLCVQPEKNAYIPTGVQQFQADELFKNRTELISVQANDPAEARFLQQLRLRTDQPTPLVAFMAPPGVMLGTYNANVTHAILAQKLAAAGKCCEDSNCKHHHPANGNQSTGR